MRSATVGGTGFAENAHLVREFGRATGDPSALASAPGHVGVLGFDLVIDVGVAAIGEPVVRSDLAAHMLGAVGALGQHLEAVVHTPGAADSRAIVGFALTVAFERALDEAIGLPVILLARLAAFLQRLVVEAELGVGAATVLRQERAGVGNKVLALIAAQADRALPFVAKFLAHPHFEVPAVLHIAVALVGLGFEGGVLGHLHISPGAALPDGLAIDADLTRSRKAALPVLRVGGDLALAAVGYLSEIDGCLDAVGTGGLSCAGKRIEAEAAILRNE